MGYFANRLKKRLEKMTDEQLEKKFLEMEESSNIGPTLDEYLVGYTLCFLNKNVESRYSSGFFCFI
jgi:hypothetical protein